MKTVMKCDDKRLWVK